MSQDNVERLLGRLITDSDFADSCSKSLEKACMELGFLVTELELTAIKETDIGQFASLSTALDTRIKRAGLGHKKAGIKK